ncbi:kelch-like protein 24 isoform X1 [Dendropsophus ebraccatus]|uniref:kelch-like protein 24 isoform X1 n=1 Tax=Dendropsophus ebraccatus TaxID=150705 RepID=UPI0038310716
MVLILGRRLNREESGVRESPATKRKVFEMDQKLSGHEMFDFNSGSSHSESILQVFNEFRESRLFTDVIICVEGREFPCHRAVLSACSSYFRAMFCNDHRESREMLVEINGIFAEAMDCFLQYVYTGKVKITTENVQYLFETSSLFQISVLRDACAKFLEEQLDPCNCLGIQHFADTHSLKTLFTKCKTFAQQSFEVVVQHEEFLELGKAEVIDYISSDDLVVSKEEFVFEAVMRWVYHHVDVRRPMLHELLTHVRLPLLHPNYFVQTVEVDQLIQNTPECYQLLHEARRYHILGNEMMSPRTRPRRSTGYSEVIVVVGGCERVGGFNLPYTECYDPVTGEWKSLAKLPEFTKSEYAVCALRNDILVSGGRINSRDVWIYNSQLNIWIRVASLNKGRWRHKMAVLLGKVYVVGGYDGQNRLSSVECYDSFSNRWTDVAPLKEAVSSPAVTSCVGKLFVIGGGPDDNTCSDKVQCYDPDTNTWLLRASIPIAKRCITAVSLNNLIYVAGGLTKAIYCYDPVEDYWIHVQNTFSRQVVGPSEMNTVLKENCGMSVCNGKIFILGGRGENGEATDTILCYDPATSIITGVAAMPRPVSYHGCVTIHRYNDKPFKM